MAPARTEPFLGVTYGLSAFSSLISHQGHRCACPYHNKRLNKASITSQRTGLQLSCSNNSVYPPLLSMERKTRQIVWRAPWTNIHIMTHFAPQYFTMGEKQFSLVRSDLVGDDIVPATIDDSICQPRCLVVCVGLTHYPLCDILHHASGMRLIYHALPGVAPSSSLHRSPF